MELSTLLAIAVPLATLLGGLGGAVINGAATRRSSVRSAEAAAKATHAKEQLDALGNYLDAVRNEPERATAAYYRASRYAPTSEIEGAVERLEDARNARPATAPGPRPGSIQMRQLKRWVEDEQAADEAGQGYGSMHRDALSAVNRFISRQDEAHAKGEPEEDPEPLVAELVAWQVESAEWARRLLATPEARAKWGASRDTWRLERDQALLEVSLALSRLERLVRAWMRGQR
ncbi:hypothetical protein [Streptomyces sp. NPDC086989]|uniref:hypothetical protein n=1 Tax=Streptomyces sp. NPDC086989 TaxID=3365764 RepID=UPI003821E0FB